tara:strand:- start:26 stop:166 length:141 start_codon:yes stop_codon:yes gene_type:complete
MLTDIESKEYIYKLSMDFEQLAYKVSILEDELAKTNATVAELNEEK